MPGLTDGLGLARESRRTMLALAGREAPSSTRRSPAANLLIAPPCELVLPRLDEVPVEHRFLSDDRDVLALAEILVRSDIATEEDWEKSDRDATRFSSLSLQRWMREHGAVLIDRRFDLDLTLSDRLVDYAAERGPDGTLYLVLDPDGAAFVLLKPTLELLERADPRLPSTFLMHFAGSLNRWVRVYDYHDAEERVDMLREWYDSPAERISPRHPRPGGAGFDPRSAGVAPGLKSGQAAGLYRRYGRPVDGCQSAASVSACGVHSRRCRGRVL